MESTAGLRRAYREAMPMKSVTADMLRARLTAFSLTTTGIEAATLQALPVIPHLRFTGSPFVLVGR
jgi:hypothetical protein